MRAVARRLALTIALGATAWATAIVLAGGFTFTLWGQRVTNHDPLRPLLVAALAFAGFTTLDGPARTAARARRVLARIDHPLLAVGLSGSVGLVGILFATTVASGADAFGYVSQADLWAAGRLHLEQPWVARIPWPAAPAMFAPLGYHPVGDGSVIVPVYSPGLPALMALAQVIGGRAFMFWVVPLSGALLVFATYALGRQLHTSRVGLAAAGLVATSPAVLFMLVTPMSDVPTAAAWTLALLWATRSTPSVRTATFAGLSAAVAILLRPNLVPLAGVLGLILAAPAWRHRAARSAHLRALAVFCCCTLPGPMVVAVINNRLHGSPLASGYGDLGVLFASRNIWPNIRTYLGWLVETETPLIVAGLAVAALPLSRVWPGAPSRIGIAGASLFTGVVGAAYLPYLQFHEWPFLRFLLPGFPFLMIGLAQAIGTASRRIGTIGPPVAMGLMLALCLHRVDVARQRGAFNQWRGDRDAVAAARLVRAHTDERSVILSLIHSGSLRYYGGRITARYDQLPADALDASVDWLRDHGVRTYALLEPWEADQFRARFAGQHAVGRLDAGAVFQYPGENVLRLFDLTAAPGQPIPVERAEPRALRNVPPVPLPALSFE